MVIGVDVAIGGELLEPPPQLSNSVVITKAKNGATTKHLFCHIKHPAMPWRLLRCQEASRENQTNLITPDLENRRHATQKKRQADFEIKVDAASRTNERRASREGGGSPMPACSWSALRRTPFRLPGGVSNRSAAAMTANKSAPERFDDDPAGLFRCIADRIFTKAGGLTKSSFEKLFEAKRKEAGDKLRPPTFGPPSASLIATQLLSPRSCRMPYGDCGADPALDRYVPLKEPPLPWR